MAIVMGVRTLKKEIQTTQIGNTKKGLLGELEVMLKLKDNLPNNYTVIWQPAFLEYKPDILVIEPKLGFLFLEVKNWDLDKVKKFYFNGKVDTNFGIKNPLGQTQNYINELQRHVNSLSGVERDIHRVTTSMVVYAGFDQESFMTRNEVASWGSVQIQSYLSKHIFKDELDSKLTARFMQSKKFKTHNIPSIINAKELKDLIHIIGEEDSFIEESTQKSIQDASTNLKQGKKRNKITDVLSVKKQSFIFGLVGLLFLLIIFITSQDFLYDYSDDTEEYSEELYERNNEIDADPLKEERIAETIDELIMSGESIEDMESTVTNAEEILIVENEEVSNTSNNNEEEEISASEDVNTNEKIDIETEVNIVSEPINTFSLGSTKNEVKSSMGTPTHISTFTNHWEYGTSSIEFNENDQVVGWTDYIGNLNVSLGNAKGGYFSLGSTKEDVVNAMGTPTSIGTYSNEWGYGSSSVEFNESDIVVGWTDYTENLNVSLGNAIGGHFSLGSTKEDVVKAMGTPTSISTYSNGWGYGSSKVDFSENDVVIGWTDYTRNLNVSLGNAKGGYFSVGSTKEDVVNAMGTPTSISTYSNEWGYGSSSVEFNESDIVVGWTDYSKELKVN